MDIAKALERIEDIKHSCDVGIAKHGEYDDLFLLDKEAIETLVFAYKETKEKLKLERKTTNNLIKEKAQLIKENAKLNLELGELQGNMQATKEIIELQNGLIKQYEDILYSSTNKEV